jgi:hypothetical protein
VEEQGVATQEIARNVQQAARDTQQVSSKSPMCTAAPRLPGYAGEVKGGCAAGIGLLALFRLNQRSLAGFLHRPVAIPLQGLPGMPIT